MSRSVRHGLSGTQCAIGFRMAQASVRTLELISPRAALTNPHSVAHGAAGRHCAAGSIFSEKIQRRLWKKHRRADAPRAGNHATARVAGQREGT